ncbi:MAG TPA: caspase family protein [Bradyrhizobium sp.]|nr:caspase family protein [Bradyrhizobium sp.]
MASKNIAVLVGVGSFDDPGFTRLRFCDNDIEDLGRVLSDPEIAQFEVIKLHEPDRDKILNTLDRVATGLQPEDKFLFYYAGHGKRSAAGKLYLVAKDTKLETLRGSAVPIDQLLDIMQESRSSQRVMILDCCHSGAIGAEFRGAIADNLQELARTRGTCILAASTGVQLAEEREALDLTGRGNGIFTRHLVDGLKTGSAAGGADYVTVDSLYEYAFQQVVTTSTQTPMKWVIGGVGTIVIAKSTAGGWQTQRDAIHLEFRNLHNQRVINGAFLDSVERVTSKEWRQLDDSGKKFGVQLMAFARKEITLIDIIPEKEDRSAKPFSFVAVQPEPEVKPNTEVRPNTEAEPKTEAELKAPEEPKARSAGSKISHFLFATEFGSILVLVAGVTIALMVSNARGYSRLLMVLSGTIGVLQSLYLIRRRVTEGPGARSLIPVSVFVFIFSLLVLLGFVR